MPNTLIVDASATSRRFWVASHATFQLMRRRNSSRAWTRARFTCTHSWSMTRRPSASLVSCAHRRVSVSARSMIPDEHSVTRSWFSWFVISPQPLFSPPTSADAGTRTSS